MAFSITMENSKLETVHKMYYPKNLLPGYKGMFITVSKGRTTIEDSSKISEEMTRISTRYTPTPDYREANKIINMARLLSMPALPLTQVEQSRNKQVDEFYWLCQMHRDQYRDRSGCLHPLDFFKTTEYKWQSPPDLTRTYLKHPYKYITYYRPTVFAQTTARTTTLPSLPDRSLAGRYHRHGDISFKR